MDKPVLIIELPELKDEGVVSIHNFLQEFMNAFEAHYFHLLRRHDEKNNEEVLF
jgi:hypothetical protein